MVFNMKFKQSKVLIVLLLMLVMLTNPVLQITATEEENIDSMDVHPSGGRYTIIQDTLTDDSIVDSSLRMITVANSSSDAGYEANRGLASSDDKIEFRLSASGAGNQTEYSRDVLGDTWDFEEGDAEGWNSFQAPDSVENGIAIYSGAALRVRHLSLDASLEVYHTLSFRYKTNVTAWSIKFFDAPVVLDQTLGITLEGDSTWNIFTFALSAITDFRDLGGISIRTVVDATISLDYIQLIGDLDFATHVEGQVEDTWDFEEADVEGWSGLSNMTNDGFGNLLMGGQGATPVIADVGNTILTSQFHLVVMNITALEGVNITIKGFKGSQFELAAKTAVPADTSLTLIFDLSQDSDWTGTFDWVGFAIDDFENGETLWLDYFLLLGHWTDVDSTIGLFDEQTNKPLVNVSIHFTSNNSHSNTSNLAWVDVEILDSDGEIAFNFTSDVFTNLNNEFLRGTIDYNIRKSKLRATLAFDNDTRIFRVNYPLSFETESGRFPAVFGVEEGLSVYFSTFTPSISWQIMRIDYILAEFEDNEWRTVDIPSDATWLQDQWDFAEFEDDVNDQSTHRINVPYFDGSSGYLGWTVEDITALSTVPPELMEVEYMVKGVDPTDGSLQLLVRIQLQMSVAAGAILQALSVDIGFDRVFESVVVHATVADIKTQLVQFSVSLREDRSVVAVRTRYFPDSTDLDTFEDFAGNGTIADLGLPGEVSTEFVLETHYDANLNGDTVGRMFLDDHVFYERDIFTDIVMAIINPLAALFFGIFLEFGRFIASIFKLVGDAIVLGLGVFLLALTAAVGEIAGGINGVLSPLLTAISTAVGNIAAEIFALVTGVLTTISDGIADIAGNIWSAFLGLVGDFTDFIEGVVANLIGSFAEMITAVIDWLIAATDDFINNLIIPLIAGMLDDLGLTPLITFMAGFITDIVAVLADVVSLLTALFGWLFANAVFWFNVDRLGALFFTIWVVVVFWLLLPFVQLFFDKDIVDWSFNDMVVLFKETGSTIFKIFDFGFKVITYLFDIILRILNTIGNYIPFT